MIESLPGHYAAGSAAASPPTDQSHPTAVLNVSAYKFVALEDLADLRTSLKQRAAAAELKGTILLATEGINLFLAGEAGPLRVFLNELQADSRFAGLPVKESWSEGQPFSRLLVKLKKEIIPFGLPGVDPARSPGRKISPAELKTWLDAGRELTLLDTRNGYEVALGTFRGAVDLDIDHFREFPAKVEALPREARQRPLVMFCTGGIRCEKAAPFVEQAGFREVYQLDGGILRYFEECGSSHYDGDCFVFDDRVAVRPDLAASGATLCYACQRVLTADEIASPLYSRGVSCPHCYRGREQILADELAKRQRAFDALAADPPGLRPYLNVRPIRVPRHLAGRSLLECLLTLMPATDETYWRAEANRELLRFASEQSSRRDGQNSANAEVPTLDRVMREGERVDHLEPECVEPVVDAAIRLIDCDELLVVVHKPSGLPSHASGRYNRHTLEYLARRVFEPELVRLTHRLDANTAGVLVLARRFAAAKSVQQQFAEGAVRKRYVARVLGHPAADRFSCDARISREPAPGGVRTVDPVGGLNAVTEFTVLRRLDDGTSLLEARPLSGRTNQIRCHLWHLRMPIENDPAYLPGGELGVNRTLLPGEPAMRLFAAEIELAHPADGQLRKWTARAAGLDVCVAEAVTPKFIVFDGIDGCGKSTQLRLFADFLRLGGIEPVCFRDPGTTPLGEAVREILLHREDIPLAMNAEMLLYMAARAQLVAEQIRPAVEDGLTVLCDRFLLANVVYQGCGGGLDVEALWQVGEIATGGLRPDLTFVFHVDVDTAMARVGGQQDRLEKRGRAFFERLREGYLSQAARAGDRVEIIDASRSIDQVQEDLRRVWREYLDQPPGVSPRS